MVENQTRVQRILEKLRTQHDYGIPYRFPANVIREVKELLRCEIEERKQEESKNQDQQQKNFIEMFQKLDLSESDFRALKDKQEDQDNLKTEVDKLVKFKENKASKCSFCLSVFDNAEMMKHLEKECEVLIKYRKCQVAGCEGYQEFPCPAHVKTHVCAAHKDGNHSDHQ